MSEFDRLAAVLCRFERMAVAVSGGVDSLTLAFAAHRAIADVEMVHAVSPAVPPHATRRVKDMAAASRWRLRLVTAGEFADPDYLSNPVNRCYFCKNNLYARLRDVTDAPIASGTNTDDLGDFRPGLEAAVEHGVHHPFVAADIDKNGVRRLAKDFDLADIAELPAQPCLASRVETGIAINARDLAFVDRVERAIEPIVGPGDLRCRITRQGFEVQLPDAAMRRALAVRNVAERLGAAEGRRLVRVTPYRKGSAFLRTDGQ